jgi:hypothetical protein
MSSHDHQNEQTESHANHGRYTYEEATELDSRVFANEVIDRRTFLSVAAATGASLALPSVVSAEVTHDSMTAEAEFAVNATPEEYEAHLVFAFIDIDAASAFDEEFGDPDWNVEEDSAPPKAVTREDPSPAAHAYLTADELDTVLDGIVLPT